MDRKIKVYNNLTKEYMSLNGILKWVTKNTDYCFLGVYDNGYSYTSSEATRSSSIITKEYDKLVSIVNKKPIKYGQCLRVLGYSFLKARYDDKLGVVFVANIGMENNYIPISEISFT